MTAGANSYSAQSLPVLDLSQADNPEARLALLQQLRSALFDEGFLYIVGHGVPQQTIDNLTDLLPVLFDLPEAVRSGMSKMNSPHFLGYSGFAEEVTLGKNDLREQFDMATELPVVWQSREKKHDDSVAPAGQAQRDLSKLYWRLRGPNQWPPEDLLPGFKEAYTELATS